MRVPVESRAATLPLFSIQAMEVMKPQIKSDVSDYVDLKVTPLRKEMNMIRNDLEKRIDSKIEKLQMQIEANADKQFDQILEIVRMMNTKTNRSN